MSQSVASRASNSSSKMLQQLASRSQFKIFKVQGSFNDQEMRVIWNSLGLYISRNLRMGRGVNIPKFGIVTFTPPQVRLKGVTNQQQRDKKPRTPVFLIQKDFVKGMNLKTAIFYHQQFGMGLRPYAVFGSNGDVPIAKMNLVQISSYANMSKDATEIALNRIFKYLGQQLIKGSSLNFQIPSVGTLISKGNQVAIRFNQHIHRQTRTILSKSVDQRKQRGLMNLTSDNLKRLTNFSQMSVRLQNKPHQFFNIDDKTKGFLRQTFGVHFNNSSQSHMKRTMTGFDKSFVSRQYDSGNNQLKNSHLMRMSMSNTFTTNELTKCNREYNFALRLVKEWVYKNSYSTEKSFKDFCRLAGTKKDVIGEDQVWKACKNISIDITEQQSQQLFRLLDYNKDGYVTQDDWNKNINFDSNKLLKQFIRQIKNKKHTISTLLKQMNLQGVNIVSVYNLKQSLKRISSFLSDDDALSLSRYLCKGKSQIQIQHILDLLNISNLQIDKNNIDNQWKQKFISRIKRKMQQNNIYEEDLLNRLKFFDNKNTGFIDQAEFKNLLGEIGIGITLSELIKIVKVFPINSVNQINYKVFVDLLNLSVPLQKESSISYNQFVRILSQTLKYNKNSFKLPISVIQLTSLLQSKLFKDYSQKSLLNHVKKMDINKDNYISQQDLNSFLSNIQQKSFKSLPQTQVHQLFMRLKQKSIRKRISFFDVFRKIDSNNNGFITKQQWLSNLDKIHIFSSQQKQNMFNYMNKNKNLGVVDYKTFLSIINSENSQNVKNVGYEKFDWVENVMDKIKKWFNQSKLTIEDSYRIVDKDADTYLSEKDITTFLIEQIKLSTQQTNLVRIKKLMKVLDTYKKGKINFLDWKNFIQKKSTNWVEDAKQQIGIVISRNYLNLQQAYMDITQGDKKLSFNSFQKWIKTNKILSGFMANDDILKHLYAELDSHKKGYLLQNDFVAAFGSYNWKIQHIKQFIAQLKNKFKTCNDAFKCLISYKNTQSLTYNQFLQSSKIIFGTRFAKSDLKNIWTSIVSDKDSINYGQFDKKYGNQWKNNQNIIEKTYPKDNWLYRDFQIIKGTTMRSQQHNYHQNEKMQNQVLKIFQNVKQILATSPKSLQQAFQQVDTQKKGRITNLQFKKAFRILNIALTAKQIDLILNYCDFKLDTLIDWRDFIKKLNLRSEKKIIFDRMKDKVQHLSDLLHYYMVSPKDAYRNCNNPRTGYMNFEQFYKMVKNVYDKANQSLPQFQILKQLFQYIDVRKDQQIDFQQFTQIFRNCKPPSLLMGTTPATDKQMISKMTKATLINQSKPIREQQVPYFKHSTQYQQLINLIGRNRKFIQTQIQKQNNQNLVSFSIVEKIIQEFANKQGLKIEENIIRNLLAFSMTGEKVDYKLMVNDFKDRAEMIVKHPKKNFF